MEKVLDFGFLVQTRRKMCIFTFVGKGLPVLPVSSIEAAGLFITKDYGHRNQEGGGRGDPAHGRKLPVGNAADAGISGVSIL